MTSFLPGFSPLFGRSATKSCEIPKRTQKETMEEAQPIQSAETQIPKPPSTGPDLPPQAPPAQNKNKRKLDNVDIHNSKYFQIRTVVKELRPYFIEVLQTPDFRNCEAADEIRKKMKLIMDLYKQMSVQTVSVGKCKYVSEAQPLSAKSKDEQKPLKRNRKKKQAEHPQLDQVPKKSPEETEKKKPEEDGQIPGSYIVGGSAFGWNFIVYPGSKPVYYGVTKESFRAKR